MTIDELRHLFDLYNRIEYGDHLAQREEEGGTVRYLWPTERAGAVLYSPGGAEDADIRIERQVRRFRELGYDMEWKHYSHDQPPDMKDRLRAQGLVPDEEEAVMVLEIEKAPRVLRDKPAHDVRRATTPEAYADADAVHRAVWGAKDDAQPDTAPGPVTRSIWPRFHADPEAVSLYVAYADSTPASFGRLELPRGSPFAGLWGGSTRAEYRGRGLYTALVAARLQEAAAKGRRYLTVDARQDTSMPILSKLGFVTIAYATAFNLPR